MPVLPDVLAPNLRILFCGSAAGKASAAQGAYYAGPGNRFWPTLFACGLTPVLIEPQAFRSVTGFGLGLTDLSKEGSGADQDLPPESDDPEALRDKVRRYRPRILAFVGKRPAQAFLGRTLPYGLQAERLETTAIFVLPSPSGAARRYWDPSHWQQLAEMAGPVT